MGNNNARSVTSHSFPQGTLFRRKGQSLANLATVVSYPVVEKIQFSLYKIRLCVYPCTLLNGGLADTSFGHIIPADNKRLYTPLIKTLYIYCSVLHNIKLH